MALILISSSNRQPIPVAVSFWLGEEMSGRSHLLLFVFSLFAKVTLLQTNETWWVTCVYGPQLDHEKLMFLEELRVRATCPGRWLMWGDFNLIYWAEDKNNHRFNR